MFIILDVDWQSTPWIFEGAGGPFFLIAFIQNPSFCYSFPLLCPKFSQPSYSVGTVTTDSFLSQQKWCRCLEAATLLLSLEKEGPVPRLSSTLPNNDKKGFQPTLWVEQPVAVQLQLLCSFDFSLCRRVEGAKLDLPHPPLWLAGRQNSPPAQPGQWSASTIISLISMFGLQVVSHPNTITFFAITLSVLLWL